MAHGCVWLGLKIMLRLRSHNRGPHKAGVRRRRSCVSNLVGAYRDERHNQGTSRRRFIGIGSAIASVSALSGAGVAQQTSPMSQVPKHIRKNETEPGPQNKPLDEESSDSVWPPSTDHSDITCGLLLREMWQAGRLRWRIPIQAAFSASVPAGSLRSPSASVRSRPNGRVRRPQFAMRDQHIRLAA
jgi:hypothetical protein